MPIIVLGTHKAYAFLMSHEKILPFPLDGYLVLCTQKPVCVFSPPKCMQPLPIHVHCPCPCSAPAQCPSSAPAFAPSSARAYKGSVSALGTSRAL